MKVVAVMSPPKDYGKKAAAELQAAIAKAVKAGYGNVLLMDGDTFAARQVLRVIRMIDEQPQITLVHPHDRFPCWDGWPESVAWEYVMEREDVPEHVTGTRPGTMIYYCREVMVEMADAAILLHGGETGIEMAYVFNLARGKMPVYWINPTGEPMGKWLLPGKSDLDKQSKKVIGDWKNSQRRRYG